nr:MAG TPA: hypothetical protein [Caudoviricetes sp.]DAM09673.1 MAG TPA: hypothetical protein [Caudoviricetes sp.]
MLNLRIPELWWLRWGQLRLGRFLRLPVLRTPPGLPPL